MPTDPGTEPSDSEADEPADISRLEAELAQTRNERDAARREVRAIRNSRSYRIGRGISRLPHSIKGLAHRVKRPPLTANERRAQPSALPAPRFARPPRATRPERVDLPDVTVVIPVFNSEKWLDDCLSRVLAQTGVTLEVLAINDGSTDDSRNLLQRYAETDPRLTILDQPNSGQSVGRNAGIDAAAGRYLVFLDSDDYWPHDTLAPLVARADDETLDVLLFDCHAFQDGAVPTEIWKRYETYYQRSRDYTAVRPGDQMIVAMRAHRDYRPHVGMYLARTEYVRRSGVRFIPGIVHQDNPYTFRLLLHAERVAHAKSDIYARRIRPGSTITALDSSRSAKGYFLSYVEMMRELRLHDTSPEIMARLCDVVHGVFDGAQKAASGLSSRELADLAALDAHPDAQLTLRAIATSSGRR